jgi:predicted permease
MKLDRLFLSQLFGSFTKRRLTEALSLDMVWRDLRFAFRAMRKTPVATAMACLTLALSIGAATAAFSVIDAAMLRPLAYDDPDRLYVVHEVLPQLTAPVVPVNATHYREWRSAARSFQEMALLFGTDVNVTGLGQPERIPAGRVSPSLFPMLGARAQIGRTFLEEEDRQGRDRVVVLSHELWRRRFGADPEIVGRTIGLDGQPHTIVGVLPVEFSIPKLKHLYDRPMIAERPQLWMPFGLWDEPILAGWYGFACIARVKPGVPFSQAVAELNSIQSSLASDAPQKSQFQASLVPLQDQIVRRSRGALRLMLGAVAMVWFIGCLNIAHLRFARGSARNREMAIRRAIGATRGRLMREMLVESVLVSAIGGIAGMFVAYGAIRLIQAATLLDIPRLDEASLDGRVLLFTLVTSLLAALASGLLPAWRMANTDPLDSTKPASNASSTANWTNRSLGVLVSLEVGTSTVCLVAAGLLLSSLVNVLGVDRGFNERHVATVGLNITDVRYRDASKRIALADSLLERVRLVRGVVSAGIASRLPLSGQAGGSVLSAEGANLPRLERPVVAILATDPGYFRTIGIPLRAGRIFDESDRDGAEVAVVAISVANRAWPGQNPVGKRFRFGRDDAPLIEVVGVVGSVRAVSLTDGPTLDVYLPYWQSDMSLYSNQLSVVVKRSEGAPDALQSIRAAIRETDPELPVPAFRTLDDIADASVAQRRFAVKLVMLLAVLAVLLTSSGIYGVLSLAVAQRTREIGIRMALGARAGDVRRLVFGHSFVPVTVGLIGGLLASVALGGVLRSMLFGITPTDPLTMTGAAAVLGSVAAVAIYFPARRATRVDPLLALKHE